MGIVPVFWIRGAAFWYAVAAFAAAPGNCGDGLCVKQHSDRACLLLREKGGRRSRRSSIHEVRPVVMLVGGQKSPFLVVPGRTKSDAVEARLGPYRAGPGVISGSGRLWRLRGGGVLYCDSSRVVNDDLVIDYIRFSTDEPARWEEWTGAGWSGEDSETRPPLARGHPSFQRIALRSPWREVVGRLGSPIAQRARGSEVRALYRRRLPDGQIESVEVEGRRALVTRLEVFVYPVERSEMERFLAGGEF